ncbi:U7 snRNA-associated Sm-like protein LSm11 [Ochlerotatus camptorhynchus]|uniref:U7 snRNA-associated Sm-like protein LSm11 n=1 Tax=Ochlerotatus camptorhynchus TaxID=644619 RepID=UPI0031D7C2AA
MSESDDESKHSTSSEGSSTDLDPTSDRYKPLRVLYSRKPQIPIPRARLHDNVSKFETQFRQLGGFDQKYNEARLEELRQTTAKGKGQKFASGSELPVRRFEPHQEMIKAEKPARFKKNIFLKLENMEGPLASLLTWMCERVRVRVYTRKEKGVRGYVTGYVEVFDKHWNMALSDVYESWKRRKYRYSENKLSTLGEAQDCSELLRKMGIDVPEVSVKSVDRKYVMCSRKVPKLMIRGEQVVLVTPDTGVEVEKE